MAIMPVMPAVTTKARSALVALEGDVTVLREPNSEPVVVAFVAEASVVVSEWRVEESLAL
jgi:hypothetical protein